MRPEANPNRFEILNHFEKLFCLHGNFTTTNLNPQTPKDVRRTFFNRIVVLTIFEPLPVVFAAWEQQIHSILL